MPVESDIKPEIAGPATKPGWRLLAQPLFVEGYLYGSAYPSLIFSIAAGDLDEPSRHLLANKLVETFPAVELPPLPEPDAPAPAIAAWLMGCVNALQILANGAVFETGQTLPAAAEEWRWLIPTEMRTREELSVAFQRFLALIAAIADGADLHQNLVLIAKAWDELARKCLPNSNSRHFIQTAIQRGIPAIELVEYIWQFGTGQKARWLYSSLTDITPNISAHIARAKWLTADLLRKAGLPVPRHRLVDGADKAVEAAQMLGYPVVVKPADLDGGTGVTTDLVTADEVRAAFAKCQELSPNVLVEQHIAGRDYRVVVFDGKAVLAIERRPGGVIGNGRDNIAALMEQQNADPLRQGDKTPLYQVKFDEEAQALLARAGLSLTSVPAAGQFVKMRLASNIARGGTPVAVFDQAHPDNLELAARAARVLRLDLAGVDLLIPDITRSWREGGAAICEVNAQPTLGMLTSNHLYGQILETLVGGGDGRVPLILVVGAPDPIQMVADIERALADAGIVSGCHDPQGVRIGDEIEIDGPVSPFRAGRALVLDRKAKAIVLSVNDLSLMATGLPIDRPDLVVLAGNNIAVPAQAAPWTIEEMLQMLTSISRKEVLRLDSCRLSGDIVAGTGQGPRISTVSAEDLPRRLLAAIEP